MFPTANGFAQREKPTTTKKKSSNENTPAVKQSYLINRRNNEHN